MPWCLGVTWCAHGTPAYSCNRGALHVAGCSGSEAAVADDAEAAALEETTATAAVATTATNSSEATEADRSVAMATQML